MATSIPRRVGIPGASTAHWGEHFCAFFYLKSDLLNLVVPYLKAGLEDNEFCLWITEDSMQQDAMDALERVLPESSQYVARKQLEILPASQWYLTAGRFDPHKSLEKWAAYGRAAAANGFEGARTTGNPFWLQSDNEWDEFFAYEHSVHEAIEKQRVISLCTYPVTVCSAKHMLGTFASHHAMLMRQGDSWRTLDLRR